MVDSTARNIDKTIARSSRVLDHDRLFTVDSLREIVPAGTVVLSVDAEG